MNPIIILIFILKSSHGLDNFHSSARNFSLKLVDSTGLDNVVIAPLNLWSLMAAAGLWTYGDSQEQVMKTLNLPQNKTIFLNEYSKLKKTIFDEKSNGVDISSGIFIYTSSDCVIYPAFRETMKTYFGAVIQTLDFKNTIESSKRANDLIAKTHNVYEVFRPEDFVDARMIISSVISFDGYWKSEFNASHTTVESRNFENDNDTYLFQMMHKRLKLPYSNMDFLNASVMELALGQDGKFCLLLILPYPNTDIKELYKKIYGVTLKEIFDKLQSDVNEFGLREINLTLPKVRIETGIVLNKPLSDIGLSDLFESNGGQFSGIAGDNLYISSIDHTCEFVIKETGVFALASTPGYHGYNIFSKMKAEHPFILFVMEKPTQTVIFGGSYTKTPYILKT